MRHAAAREELVHCSRRLVTDGLYIGTAGNVSARVGDEVVITPSGADPDRLGPADMVVVDLAGRVVEGTRTPSSELAMHLVVYGCSDEAGAIVHTHSPFATALACVDGLAEVPPVHYTVTDLGGPIRVAPYATFGTDELAGNVRDALTGRRAALLQNHGVLALGPDLSRAYGRAALVEWLCGVYVRAASVGRPRVLSPAALDDAAGQFTRLRYGEGG